MTSNLLGNIRPAKGSRRKPRRIGRGQGSGRGGTATRGHKGAGSRSGTRYIPGFEGGQMPLVRRVPKRGFHSPFKKEYQLVNVELLQKLAADGRVESGMITPEILRKLGVVKKGEGQIKVLGNGELKSKLHVSAHAFSKSAVEKIQSAGGKVQTISVAVKE